MQPSAQREYDTIVQLTGGFGNQLFQYAFGMQLEAVYGRRVSYDLEFYRQPNSVAHNRLRLPDYGFDVPGIVAQPKGYESARRLKWLPSPAQQALFGVRYVKCPATRYVSVAPTSGLNYFAGLWQSPSYFEAIADDVRDLFRERLIAAGSKQPVARQCVVGFHVRRGDYLTHKQSQNLDYARYLSAALDQLAATTGISDPLVSVYTDDPDWCEAHLRCSRIEINRGGGMLDDLLGLMHCEYKIISNSTFAWWAAFLGEADGALTVAPRRWHADADSDEAKVLRPGWIVVDD